MFGIGFFEIVVVFLVAVAVLDHTQLKEYIRICKLLYSKMNNIKRDFLDYIYSLDKTTDILGEDGKIYKAYKLGKDKENNDGADINS